jgi:hypothetical protein
VDRSRRLVVLLLVLAPAIGHAAARRSVVVEVAPAGDWRAEALARTLTADLTDDRLAPRAMPECRGPCDDAALRGAGVELVVRATLGAAGPGTLGYELRGLWAGAPGPVRSAAVLGAHDRAGFAGVVRDRLHRMARATGEEAEAAVGGADLPSIGEVAVVLGAVLALLATPIAAGFAFGRRWRARRAAGRTLLGVAALGAIAMAVAVAAPSNGRGVLFAAGGLAWAVFAAVTAPVVFPPLVGLGRVDSSELWRVLAGWSGLVVQRAIAVAVVYAPIVAAVVLAPELVDVSASASRAEELRFALVLPLALLVARQWVRLAIAVAAERLDDALIDPAADAGAWQDAVRGYVVGYLRRNGLPGDDDVLERLRVLPAIGDEVCVYGGGATHPRIAIPRAMLELALAPAGRPHDYAAPRVSTLHWTQWNAGLVMATDPGAVIATREQRQPRQTTTDAEPGDSAREVLGEPPTLIGIVEPRALDPRPSYRPHDDPAWLDWDAGDDYDGTDPGDRDFLFGVMVRAVAQIQRHGDRLNTLAIVLRRASRFTVALGRAIERSADAIGDDHAAIRGARHHLVQYLGWEAWQREDLLTARAYAPELEAMSLRVLAATERSPERSRERSPERSPEDTGREGSDVPDQRSEGAAETNVPGGRMQYGPLAERDRPASRSSFAAVRARARLARLAGLVRGAPAVRMRWRRLALAGALVAGAGVAALAVADAVRYHGTASALRGGERQRSTEREKPDHGKN